LLAKEYGLSQSTISTILLNKDKMKTTEVSDASTRMVKGRERIVEMETVVAWIRERQMQVSPQMEVLFVRRLKASLMTFVIGHSWPA
jgi:hypothetical protein